MRVVVAGLGVQGAKRSKFAGSDLVATVDPIKEDADYKNIQDVPLDYYDAALLCIPDNAKVEILNYLIDNDKHFLVEKPLINADKRIIEDLYKKAQAKNIVAYTAYNHRFEPHIATLKSHIDSGKLGKIYSVDMFYGNGTARDVRNSEWRDQGMGVLSDLGSHLLDTFIFLFGEDEYNFEKVFYETTENRAPDHIMFKGKKDFPIQMEATMLSWRNTFRLNVLAEKGSAHIECLCKWGPSILTTRERVLPSGKPSEDTQTLEQADPTWELEYVFFKEKCTEGKYTNLNYDMYINKTLNNLWEQR